MSERPVCFTATEAAELLGVCVQTLRKRMHEGLCPYRRIGKRMVVTLTDLEKFLDRSEVKAPVTRALPGGG